MPPEIKNNLSFEDGIGHLQEFLKTHTVTVNTTAKLGQLGYKESKTVRGFQAEEISEASMVVAGATSGENPTFFLAHYNVENQAGDRLFTHLNFSPGDNVFLKFYGFRGNSNMGIPELIYRFEQRRIQEEISRRKGIYREFPQNLIIPYSSSINTVSIVAPPKQVTSRQPFIILS